MSNTPIVTFMPGYFLHGGPALPITMADGGSLILPSQFGPSVGSLRLAGYNTLSLFVTITNLQAGNTYKIVLSVVDPETGAVLAGNLGDVTLISKTASGSFATTLYLPTYYATLSALVLPFDNAVLTLSNTGGHAGNMQTTALKLWLTNA